MKSACAIFLCLFFALTCLTSCGKNCGSVGWALDLQDEINNLSVAAQAYSQNPSPGNCEAYRQAYLDYIHALKDWDKCVDGVDRDSWRQSLNEAENDLDD